MSGHDDFYIGYAGGMPVRTRRAVIGAIIVAMSAGMAAAVIFVSQQRALADARFEFGQVQTFEGYLSMTPAPVLLVRDGNATRPHWLVAPGKFGAAAAIGGAAAGWVRVDGTLVARESWRMIEVQPGTVRSQASSAPAPMTRLERTRAAMLRGEIVDSKCFLGVMNPGERTVHRDCAVRCLSGGIPPMFFFDDADGSHLALLLGAGERWLREHAGRSITVSGVLSGPEESLVLTISAAR